MRFPRFPFRVGSYLTTNLSNTNYVLNGSSNRLAFVMRSRWSTTLQKLRFYVSSITGTMSSSDLLCAVYTGDGDAPQSQVTSEVSVSNLSAGYCEFDFSSLNFNMSLGSRYWFIIRNNNSVPASNYPSIFIGAAQEVDGFTNPLDWNATYTSANGIVYSPSTRAAFLVSTAAGNTGICYQSVSSIASVYGSRMHGVRFTVPNGIAYKVNAICMLLGKIGSAQSFQYRIYQGSNLVAQTVSTQILISTPGIYMLPFSSTVTLYPGIYHLVVWCSASTSSDAVQVRNIAIDSSAANLNRLPLDSRYVYTTDGGMTWAIDNGSYPAVWLLLLDESAPIMTLPKGQVPSFSRLVC